MLGQLKPPAQELSLILYVTWVARNQQKDIYPLLEKEMTLSTQGQNFSYTKKSYQQWRIQSL